MTKTWTVAVGLAVMAAGGSLRAAAQACDPPCEPGQTCYPDNRCLGEPEALIEPPPPPPEPPGPPPSRPLLAYPEPEPELDTDAHATLRLELSSRRHERYDRYGRRGGFMARVTLGLGAGVATIDADPDDYKLSGVAGAFSVDVGGSIQRGLILHGRLASMTIADPELSDDYTISGPIRDLRADAYLLGVGLNYYIMPANIYLDLVLGISWLDLYYVGEDGSLSNAGLGVNIDIGKEWWVAPDWSIGLAGRFWFSYTNDTVAGYDYTDHFTGVALLFSATYR